jgi:hypothetical protein
MRKVILFMLTSLDGYFEGPDQETFYFITSLPGNKRNVLWRKLF